MGVKRRGLMMEIWGSPLFSGRMHEEETEVESESGVSGQGLKRPQVISGAGCLGDVQPDKD